MTEFIYPRPAVCVFVFNQQDEILLMQRAGSHGAGTWSIPGGGMDLGETISKAVARELFEETSIKVYPSAVKIGPTINDIFIKEGKQFINTVCSYLCQMVKKLRLPNLTSALKCVGLN